MSAAASTAAVRTVAFPAPPPPLRPAAMPVVEPIYALYWSARNCWICGKLGHCAHREAEIASAEAERMTKRRGEGR